MKKTIAVFCILLVCTWIILNQPPRKPINAARVAKNLALTERCQANHNECIGGFVKYDGNPKIFQLVLCRNVGVAYLKCHTYEQSIIYLTEILKWHKTAAEDQLNREEIILPDDPAWEGNTLKFCRQFVVYK